MELHGPPLYEFVCQEEPMPPGTPASPRPLDRPRSAPQNQEHFPPSAPKPANGELEQEVARLKQYVTQLEARINDLNRLVERHANPSPARDES
jgi:hypothetical protein